jgi:hypothetical protein
MLQSFLSQIGLIFFSFTLAILAVACREDKQSVITGEQQSQPTPQSIASSAIASPQTTALPTASPEPQPIKTSQMQPNSFELGLDKAASADTISQSAQSPEDWSLVVNQYQNAIALMKQVERQSPYFTSAQNKILEYQRQIKYAQQQASPRWESPPPVTTQAKPNRIVLVVPQASPTPKIAQEPPPETPEQLLPPLTAFSPPPPNPQQVLAAPSTRRSEPVVFVAPIKRRVGGTPIIDVTFNGNQQFEMILDTGASGTVITQDMANALAIVPVGKAKANTASAKAVEFPIGYVNSIEVGGMSAKKIAVAIAGAELETGLLGHDFFGDYEITIKRNVVEFRPPSSLHHLNSSETGLTPPTSPKPHHSGEYP